MAMAVLAMAGASVFADGPDHPLVTRWQGRTMGSPYTVQISGTHRVGAELETLRDEVEKTLDEVNRQMSNYQPDSELSRFNRVPAHTPFPVSSQFARVVRFALDMSRRSDGAFDPTLGPVVNLWGFGEQSQEQVAPSDEAIQASKRRTGWAHLSVTDQDELVKDIDDLAVDLGGVAKGFGVDQMGGVLERHGLTNYYVSIAGEVRVRGLNPRAEKWHLGITTPVDNWTESDSMAAGVRVSNQALSTSGDYHKFYFDEQGRRLSHIMDPRTGRPVAHTIAGVSVVGPDGMTADALGTTLYVLGLEEGLQFIDGWPNAAALFILREPDGTFRQVPSSRFAVMAEYEP